MGDDVELVEGDPGIGQMLGDAQDVRRRHVDGDGLDGRGIAAVGGEIGGKGLHRLGLSSLGDEQDPALVGIGHQGDVVIAAGLRRLVRRQALDGGEVGLRHTQIDVALADRHHLMPGQIHQSGNGREGHFSAQGHDQRLEQQREAGQPAGPAGFNLPNAAIGQTHPRHPDLQVALVLEEIQMPIALGYGVVGRMHNPAVSSHGPAYLPQLCLKGSLRRASPALDPQPRATPPRAITHSKFKRGICFDQSVTTLPNR